MPIFPLAPSSTWFPDPSLAEPDGLIAVGGDLSTDRLLQAYRSGIFPWTTNPITWWSPDPRAIFPLAGLHLSRGSARALRKNQYRITLDTAFDQVIRACAQPAPGREETWISPEFIESYTALHRAGHAHSVECWTNDTLVGGVYGVAIAGFFAGESMFHRAPNASKAALTHLLTYLRNRGFLLFDTQVLSPATAALGAIEIPRPEYLTRLAAALRAPCNFSA